MAQRTRSDSESSSYGEKRNLYVKNIDPDVPKTHLLKLFEDYGNISREKIIMHQGRGYVEFEQPEQAAAAIKGLNSFRLGSKLLFVDYYQPRDERSLLLAGIHLMKDVNLFVQNLDKSIDHQDLQEVFSQYGRVISVRIATRNNLSPTNNGFVCYSSKSEADQAIQCLNGQTVRGRKITVKVHDKDALQKQENNLRVDNLSPAITDTELHQLFAKYGSIKSAKVMVNNRKRSKGYGYVCFETQTEAERALNEMDNAILFGKRISVYIATKGSSKRSEGSLSDDDMSENGDVNMVSRIFVKNLESWMDEGTLERMFSSFGGICSTKIMRESGDSPCCGTVTFLNLRNAQEAIEKMNGFEIRDEVYLEVQLDETPSYARNHKDPRTTLLYIKELDPRVTDRDLRKYFENFGQVKSARIDEMGGTSNVGHVNMSTHQEAKHAVEEADGSPFFGRNLFVTLHMSKDERKEFKEKALLDRLRKIALADSDDSGTNEQPNDLNCNPQPEADNFTDAVNERSRRVRAKSAAALNRKKMNLQPFESEHSGSPRPAGVKIDPRLPTKETCERKPEPRYSNVYQGNIPRTKSRASRSRKQKSRPMESTTPRHVGTMLPTGSAMKVYDENRNVPGPSKPFTYMKPQNFAMARDYYAEYEGPYEPSSGFYNICYERYAHDEASRLDPYHQSQRLNGRSKSTVAQRLFRK